MPQLNNWIPLVETETTVLHVSLISPFSRQTLDLQPITGADPDRFPPFYVKRSYFWKMDNFLNQKSIFETLI